LCSWESGEVLFILGGVLVERVHVVVLVRVGEQFSPAKRAGVVAGEPDLYAAFTQNV
jgi:hypothetical protein